LDGSLVQPKDQWLALQLVSVSAQKKVLQTAHSKGQMRALVSENVWGRMMAQMLVRVKASQLDHVLDQLLDQQMVKKMVLQLGPELDLTMALRLVQVKVSQWDLK